MLQRDPVVFAADGFDQIHELDCVNERVISGIAKQPGESRRRSRGGIGTPTISSPAESKSVASKLDRPSRRGRRRPRANFPGNSRKAESGSTAPDSLGL